ncbi:MAG: cache domain-containing protein, partial [Campylobacterota bacterium]|nr:cache domain-containing protein [Campylobacterota bacterium]
MSNKHTKYTRIILPIATALLLFLSLFVAYIYKNQTSQEYKKHKIICNKSYANIQEGLTENIKSIIAIEEVLLNNNSNLLHALKDQNRDLLLQDNSALFKRLKKEFDITHFYFHLPNRVNLLRVHAPNRHGDTIDRFTLISAQKTLKISSGIELGPLGTFTLRVVKPIIYNNELIGYLELGKEIEDILKRVAESMNVSIALALDKKHINRSKWEVGMKMLKRTPNWNRYKNKVISYSSENIPKTFDTFIEEAAHQHNKGKNLSTEDGDYFILFKMLFDVANKEVGDIIIYYDSAQDIADLKSSIVSISVIFFIVFILLLLILSSIILKNEQKIYNQQDKLKKQNIYINQILDAQENLTVITDGKYITKSNHSVLDFFGYTNLDDFYKENHSICDFFMDGNGYLQKEQDGKSWLDVIYANPDISQTVKMKNIKNEEHIFQVNANKQKIYSDSEEIFVINFTDITELIHLKNSLEMKIQTALSKNTKQLQILQQQSKMAQMGEMIGAIAHQWRQPLNELGLSIQNLKYDYRANKVDEEFIHEFIEYNKKTIMFMSKTIDDFRSFFRVDKTKRNFNVKETTESVVAMQSAQLKSHEIKIELSGDEFEYNGLQSEYQQVILNIVNNAKDALIEKEIENPTIEIELKENIVTIKDNAGGIPQDIIERVFEPYFTT